MNKPFIETPSYLNSTKQEGLDGLEILETNGDTRQINQPSQMALV